MNQPLPSADPEKDQRLNAVLAEYMKRKDAGRPVNQKTLLAAYPDLADALQSWFEGEALIEGGVLAATKLGKVPPRSNVRETIRPSAVESDTASEFTPRMFGRYQLLRPLGEGAMGSVFLSKDTTLDRQVALKVPKSEATGNAEFMHRFTREAKAAAALKHPNICSVYDAGEHEGTAYITMDFIDGVPLSRFIGSSKLQSLESILRMLKTIAQAIEHAHSKGVIHRDLKPGNILVDEDFKPVVTDFGLARRVESSDESRITQEGLLIGTPAYMAPEQVKGEQAKVGTGSDIYSLGVIFFEMLTCRLPFEGKISEVLAKVLRDAPPIPSKIRADLPEDVDDLCLKMLQKLPEHRYGSIADVIKAITLLENKIKAAPVAPGPNAQQQSPFEIQKAHIELMLKKGQYAAAIQDLEKLAAEKSPGARVVGEWARKTLTTARAESKALSPAGLAAMLQTAEQMFQKSDYLGCIQLLEDVPALRRTEGMEDLVKKARKREADAEQLLANIKDLEHRQQVDGLEPLVKRFLKLKPGSAYGKRLFVALQTYNKTPASRRRYRYEKGRLQPMPEPGFLRQWAVLGSLVFILVFLSVYSYVIFYLKSGNQTLAVQVDDEWLRVQGGEVTLLVDGNSHTISTTSATGEDLSVVVTLGEHTFSVNHGDTVVHDPRIFQIEKDGRRILRITATDMQLTNVVEKPSVSVETLAKDVPASTKPPIASGVSEWISLFDGADVSRWSSLGPYQLQNGLLIAKEGQSRSAAVSSEEYGDFELEAEWRIGPMANGGIYYRELATTTGAGNEYQLIDPAHPQLTNAAQRTGALYGIVAPSEVVDRPIGEWNSTKIICRGSIAEHWVNGKKVVQYDTFDPAWTDLKNSAALNTAKERVGTQSRGHILLNWQSGEIAFRSIRIRPLRSDNTAAMAQAQGNQPPLAIAPFDAAQAKASQEAWAKHLGVPVEVKNSIGMKLKLIPAGEFLMGSLPDEAARVGSSPNEAERSKDEAPQHRVWITKPFYMSVTEVTQGEWYSVLGTKPWDQERQVKEGDNYPAVYVSWDDAVEYCKKLSTKDGETYRLPTEAEWENACRAGKTTEYSFDASDGSIMDYAWVLENAFEIGEQYAHVVGTKKANQFGLYDMHGNVYEWCEDVVDVTAYGSRSGTTSDPFVSSGSEDRVLRGGSWHDFFWNARSANRGGYQPVVRMSSVGFRVVRNISETPAKTAAIGATEMGDSGQPQTNIEVPDPNASLKYSSQVHGATKQQLITWADGLPEGMTPHWISVRATEKQPLFDAIAIESADRGDWNLEFLNNENKEARASFEKQRGARRIEVYNVFKNSMEFERLVVWSNGEHTAWWNGGSGFIANRAQADSKTSDGSRRQRMSNGVTETWLPSGLCSHDLHYSLLTTWQPYGESQAEMSLSDDELLTKVDEYRKKGWRPHIVDSILYSSPQRYLAVFVDNPRAEKWDFSARLTTKEYRQQLSSVDSRGGRPRCVCSREENGEIYYSVVWDYPVNPKAKAPPIADNDFQAIAPFITARAKKYQNACAAHLKLPVEYTNSIGMKFRLIPPGTFTIGSSPEQIATAKPHLHTSYESNRPERADSEGPQRVVTLTKPFYLGTTEVTQSQFLQVVGANPSVYSPTGEASEKVGQTDRSNSPAENMSWLATGEFCNRLSEHEKLEWAYRITPQLITQTGTGGYRLPTEAEWEFACRAGTTMQYWCGHSDALLLEVAWFRGNNPNGFPSDVAKLRPNPFGLYDMHGNVWEWVHDCWRADTYENWTGAAAVDPRADTAPEDRRVMRGGDFFLSAEEARSACRDGYPHDAAFHDAGFRVALSIDAVRQMLTAK